MDTVRVLLIQENKPPLQAQLQLNKLPLHVADNLVQISVGGDISRGSVTVPLEVLSALIAQVMDAATKRPGIVVPNKGMIMPNIVTGG